MFSGLEIEMILFAKTGKQEPVFQFALRLRKLEKWRHKTETGKLEKCDHENWNTPPFQFLELENCKTVETEKV